VTPGGYTNTSLINSFIGVEANSKKTPNVYNINSFSTNPNTTATRFYNPNATKQILNET